MRGRRPGPPEDDGLQADVMRFMAIIAFCLVAIFALVRQVEPEVTQHEAVMPTASIPPEAVTLKPSLPERNLVTAQQLEPAAVPAREPQRSNGMAVSPEAADNPEEGLVLRFASDSDFLRLVNSGRLEVFAFSDDGAWRLRPGLTLESAAAPGALHELLPSTLPAALLAALNDEDGGAGHLRWGMRMPAGMEAQIRAHLRSASGGALVIDRNGEVRHETDG